MVGSVNSYTTTQPHYFSSIHYPSKKSNSYLKMTKNLYYFAFYALPFVQFAQISTKNWRIGKAVALSTTATACF